MERKIKALIQQALDIAKSSREIYLTMANLVERPKTKETLQYLANNEERVIKGFSKRFWTRRCPLEVPLEDTHVSEFLKCPHITRKISSKEALFHWRSS